MAMDIPQHIADHAVLGVKKINLNAITDRVAAGTITSYGGATAPDDWLLCDGTAVSRATYSVLFDVIGTTFGVGDGSTTFNVPDLQGVGITGAGTQDINGRAKGGDSLGDTVEDAGQGHYHRIDKVHTLVNNFVTGTGNEGAFNSTAGTADDRVTIPITDGSNGTPRTDTETKMSSVVVNFIIKHTSANAALTADLSDDTPIESDDGGTAGSGLTASRDDHSHPQHPMIIWRMVNNETAGDQTPLGAGGSDWEVADDLKTEEQLGTNGVTESSGIFSFATTGYWSVRAYFEGTNASALDIDIKLEMHITDDNSAYTQVSRGVTSTGAATHNFGGSCETLLKIADVANDKIRFAQNVNNANSYFTGANDLNRTYIVFTKIADL